ncbi:MAG: hypothetical protein ABIO17_06920 [Pseudoxanthomonas sp.]
MSNSSRTIIVATPQGSGKTQHASAIAARFGCNTIVEEWDGVSELPDGALVLTNLSPAQLAGVA